MSEVWRGDDHKEEPMKNFPFASVLGSGSPQWRSLSSSLLCSLTLRMSDLFTRILAYFTSRFTCLSSPDEFDHCRSSFVLEQLPNELFLEVFVHLSLEDLHRSFYGLNRRLNDLIIYSCLRGEVIRSTAETNFYLKHILPEISPGQVQSLHLSHNSSVSQLLDRMPRSLSLLTELVLRQLKNVSFVQCRELLHHLPWLERLSMIDFNTPQVDWLDDSHWSDLIERDLPRLRRLNVRICIIYHKQIHEDDKENIIYSYTSRFARPIDRMYTGVLKRRDPILEMSLTIDRAFPRRETSS